MTKINITNIGTNQHHVPTDMMYQKEHDIISVIFLLQMYIT